MGVASGSSGVEFLKVGGDVNVGSDKVLRIAREAVGDAGQIHFMNGAGGIGSQISGGAENNYINGGGNFGVGITTPTVKLHVNGRTFLTNQSAPSTPTGGGIIYVEAGALKYIGSSGTITTLGVA